MWVDLSNQGRIAKTDTFNKPTGVNMKTEVPTAFPWNHGDLTCTGMTLRDYFAAKAMQGMVSSPELLRVVTAAEFLGNEPAERCSTVAYRWADAMLKARGK
jgi:hypothetical protein